jgi:hypothetical protein
MIRSVGMSRRQVRRSLIRYESVVPRCFGSRSGVLLALIATGDQARGLHDPAWDTLVVFVIAAIIAESLPRSSPHVRRVAQRARGASARVAHEPSLDSPHRLSAGAGREARVGGAALVEVVLMALVRDLAVHGHKLAWIDR